MPCLGGFFHFFRRRRRSNTDFTNTPKPTRLRAQHRKSTTKRSFSTTAVDQSSTANNSSAAMDTASSATITRSSTATTAVADMIDTLRTVSDKTSSSTASDATISSATADLATLITAQHFQALTGVAVGDLLFIIPVPRQDESEDDEDEDAEHESDDEDAEHEDEDGNDEDADGEAEADAESHDGDDADQDDAAENENNDETIEEDVVPPRMFIVTDISKNNKGGLADIKVTQLTYSKLVDNNSHTYQIYGNDIVPRHTTKCQDARCTGAASITTILTDPHFFIMPKPQGDYVRRVDTAIGWNPRHSCISGCNNGWLQDIAQINGMVADHDSPLLAYEGDLDEKLLQPTVCPVCIGLDFLQEQEVLQGSLLATGWVDISEVFIFESRLNPRRTALGYSFRQFDERDWGHRFGDLDEDGDGEDDEINGGWDDPYEHFPEALDPNAYIKTSPATEATIKALPRNLFGKTSGEPVLCPICRFELKEDQVVIELPCGHRDQHEECLMEWLKQQETCTTCRRVVPAAKESVEESMEGSQRLADGSDDGLPPYDESGWDSGNGQDWGGLPDGEHDEHAVGDIGADQPKETEHPTLSNGNIPELATSSSWATMDGEDTIMSD